MIKLIHGADLHLDSPFSGLSPERAAQVPFSIRATERPRRPWQARSRRKFSIGV